MLDAFIARRRNTTMQDLDRSYGDQRSDRQMGRNCGCGNEVGNRRKWRLFMRRSTGRVSRILRFSRIYTSRINFCAPKSDDRLCGSNSWKKGKITKIERRPTWNTNIRGLVKRESELEYNESKKGHFSSQAFEKIFPNDSRGFLLSRRTIDTYIRRFNDQHHYALPRPSEKL
ncbi:PREDICTED: uncharacterized protein LOC105143342 isoform X2 [Acromyrmex echinatior]|uniref:uncharacterized protein LOC105143342 isoform X2 n=1 Tax=Acromyrmex echinatior TaxID=103372 RepID=UPI000580EF1B|nr:PREDICTED: uncharacterized protein LOC105143342 isoform X2 [Acromyrmex echinatior]